MVIYGELQMTVEKITTTNRIDLLTQIEGFLTREGWITHRKSSEMLYVSDENGAGVTFKFISYRKDPNYGYSERSSIYVCDSIDNSLDFNTQAGSTRVGYFMLKNNINEFNSGFLIGDSKNFILYIDSDSEPSPKYNLLFTVGYINKSHEFNGGRVAFSSRFDKYYSGYNWGGYYDESISYGYIPFSRNSKTLMSLGGIWRNLHNADLNASKILTNLCRPYTSVGSVENNELSALSVVNILDVGKSMLSGLYTLITPNFFYKNNKNIWVHAGEFDLVRILKDEPLLANRFTNGQILHLGSEKFMLLRPHGKQANNNISNLYTMAVRIA